MSNAPSQPPTLAVFLLRHLCPKDNQEALIGDLLESFREGRSDGWFWRQVLIAVLAGVSKVLRLHWPQICFAAAGTALLWRSSWIRIMRIPPIEQVRVWGIGLPWPVSGVYEIGLVELLRALIVLPLVTVLLVLTGSLGWARMARAMFISLVLLAIGEWALFWWPWGYRIDSYSLVWLRLMATEGLKFLALLISAWVSCPSPAHPRPIAK
jgi:hypothetical protein